MLDEHREVEDAVTFKKGENSDETFTTSGLGRLLTKVQRQYGCNHISTPIDPPCSNEGPCSVFALSSLLFLVAIG